MSNSNHPSQHSIKDHHGDVVDKTYTDIEASPGVEKVEAITSEFTKTSLVVMYVGILLLAYATSLDGLTSYTYQVTATDSFDHHALTSTLNVVRSVMQAVSQPPIAKIADVFGRLEAYITAVCLYAIGYVIVTTSNTIEQYAAGLILYVLGSTGLGLLQEIIIGDTTTLRNRVIFAIMPSLPFIVNTWISGNVASAIITNSTWRWGIGMFAIMVPVLSLPIIISLLMNQQRARKSRKMKRPLPSIRMILVELDVIGLLLVVAGLSLLLIPLTLASSTTSKWHNGSIIAMIVLGGVLCFVFVIWESFASHPLLPLHLIKDRSIVGGLIIALFVYISYFIMSDYFYSVLLVAKGLDIITATRITNLYSFVSVIICFGVGFAVRKVRYLRPFQLIGAKLYILGLGLLIHFRGTASSTAEIAITQVILGIGGGFLTYPTQTAVQAAVKHQYMAVATALYLTTLFVGGAIGAAIGGAMWTSILPNKLEEYLPLTLKGNATTIFNAPFEFIATYPLGTPERDAVNTAFYQTQKLLLIVATCLAVPILFGVMLMRNPQLTSTQSLPATKTRTKTEQDEIDSPEE